MNRSWQMWCVFGACLALVLVAMGWVSRIAYRLESAEREAQRQAALEESIQLALWRMEAALSPLLAEESGRPYFAYRPFHTPASAYTHLSDPADVDEVLLPSPLLRQRPPFVRVHFQIGPDGRLTSPQVSVGRMRDLAEDAHTTSQETAAASAELEMLRSSLDVPALRGLLSVPVMALARPADTDVAADLANEEQAEVGLNASRMQQQQQRAQRRGDTERKARVQQVISNVAPLEENRFQETGISGGPIRPLWLDGLLLLARSVRANGDEYIQGCRLDWPALKRRLLDEIADLLPGADLEPVETRVPAGDSRTLAAIPVRLVPGEIAEDIPLPPSAIRMSLLIAWGGVALGAIAIAVLLHGAIGLSERRAAFVSAVTHELRTPLTTLGLYAEMLRKDMVDETKRSRYLDTMHKEVQRLGHLVNNVLASARLERGPRAERLEVVMLKNCLSDLRPRLEARAEQDRAALKIEIADEVASTSARVDPGALEQILLNLVDNACKYGLSQENRTIHWQITSTDSDVIMRVRDHGRGIPSADRRRIFRPFRKSARDAAHSAPGVGLGLSLSRRLARSMGGDLQIEDGAGEGACFRLRLPRA
jgi:signal transduction histidine kinase